MDKIIDIIDTIHKNKELLNGMVTVIQKNDLPELSDYMYQATTGKEYHKLTLRKQYWGKELHERGHVMDKDELFEIYKYGILYWYCEQMILSAANNVAQTYLPEKGFYDTGYNYKGNAEYLIQPENQKYISNYDIRIYLQLIGEFSKTDKEKALEIMQNIDKYLEPYKVIIMIDDFIKKNHHILADKINEIISNNDLNKKIGIAFQRYKIVAEQTAHGSLEGNDILKKNLGTIDKLLDDLQKMIYYYVFLNKNVVEDIIQKVIDEKEINIGDELKKINLNPYFLSISKYKYIGMNIDLLVKPVNQVDFNEVERFITEYKKLLA